MLAPQGKRPDGFFEPDIPYARGLKKDLARFGAHPAAAMNADPAMLAFKFSDRSQLLLRLSPLPALTERLTVQYSLIDRAGGAENMRRWLAALRGLSESARFPELFASRSKLLEPAVERFRAKERKQDFLGTIEAYAGLPLIGTYTVNLTPFQSPGGVANVVTDLDDGSMEISSVMGAEPAKDDVEFWATRTPGTLWHESAHGILDGLADMFDDKIAESSEAHRRLGWDCYGVWKQCVKEHFVRAVMIRLMAREISEAAAEEQIDFEKEEHYPYLRPLLEKLKVYEKERARYPTLADFYPRLLEVFPADKAKAAKPAEPLPASQARRLRRLAQVVQQRAKEPAVVELARRYAAAQSPSGEAPPLILEKPAGPPEKGVAAFRAGRLEEALRSFDEALAASPDDRETWMSRGVVLQALSRKQEALASYDRAVALADAGAGAAKGILPDALSSRASVLLELGLPDRARADLSRALALGSADWPQRADAEARLKALGEKRP